MHTEAQIQHAVMAITRDGEASRIGLGLLCGDVIVTCAHLLPESRLQYPSTCLFECRAALGGPTGVFASHYASSVDFMLLASDGVDEVLSEGGPTDSHRMVVDHYSGRFPAVRPSRLEFRAGQKRAVVPGYHFAPDGATRRETKFLITAGSPTIHCDSPALESGCSGGPLLTLDHHFIGVATNSTGGTKGMQSRDGIGRRVDLCFPQFALGKVGWDVLKV